MTKPSQDNISQIADEIISEMPLKERVYGNRDWQFFRRRGGLMFIKLTGFKKEELVVNLDLVTTIVKGEQSGSRLYHWQSPHSSFTDVEETLEEITTNLKYKGLV
jgi:hypothetical protein